MNENIQPHTSDEEAAILEPKTHRGIDVAVISLFAVALIGIWRLVTNWDVPHDGMTSWTFYLDVALVVVPLFFMAITLNLEGRLSEGLRLGALYQERLDRVVKKLALSEAKLRLVSDYQVGTITIFDRQNRYWFVNKQAAKKIGLDPSEIIGRPPVKILSNDMAKKLEIKLAQSRTLDEPIEYVERLTDKAGETKFIQYHFEGVVGATEDINGCVLLREEDFTTLFVERERRERMLRQVIDTLVAVVDRRDPYAAGHSLRVGQLAKAIAGEMDLDDSLTEAAEIAGSLMNFGKVLVPRHILTKTTNLTQEELQRVRDSILNSSDILAIIGFEGPVVPTLRQVLERYDGSGVPSGLIGDAIIVSARIVAVANAFVAFVSPRAHRAGLASHEALAVMAQDGGKVFDERVLIALTNYIENRPNKLDWIKVNKQKSI